MAAARWAFAKNLVHRDGAGAGHAPARARQLDDLQARALRDAAECDGLEAKCQGIGLDAGQLADLQPDRAHGRKALLARRVLDQLQNPLGE